jgi:hypothetical protein
MSAALAISGIVPDCGVGGLLPLRPVKIGWNAPLGSQWWKGGTLHALAVVQAGQGVRPTSAPVVQCRTTPAVTLV